MVGKQAATGPGVWQREGRRVSTGRKSTPQERALEVPGGGLPEAPSQTGRPTSASVEALQ